MRKIKLSRQSKKFLADSRLPTADKNRIDIKLRELENSPNPLQLGKKLQDSGKFKNEWSARVGWYRIFYHLEGDNIIVSKIAKRPKAYR